MRRSFPPALLALGLALLLSACGGGGVGSTPIPTPTATPTPPPAPLTPQASPTPTPTPPPEPSAYRFLFAEIGQEADAIWQVTPHEPSQREQVAVIEHGAGWGIRPSLSPGGQHIAYTVMPEGALDRFTQAEAYLLDLESGESQLLAQNVDLTFRPLWSPEGKLLYLRRNVLQEVMILQVDLTPLLKEEEEEEGQAEEQEGEETPPVRTVMRADVSDVLTFIPLGFDQEKGRMYFAQVQGGTQQGTLLGAYAPATLEAMATATAVAQATATALAQITPTPTPQPAPTPAPLTSFVLTLSDQTARDFALSPDGRALLFTAQDLVEGRFISRAFLADLRAKRVSPLPAEGLPPGDQLRPLWHPDGRRVTLGFLPSGGEPGAVALLPLDGGEPTFLFPPEAGFDLPLSWAPDGRFLAALSYQGDSLANPGRSRLMMLAPTGQRLTVAEGIEVEVVGWVKAE